MAIVGAARQGTALARYLARHGAHVVLNDRRPADEMQAVVEELAAAAEGPRGSIRFVFGGHPLELLQGTDMVCLSGGVSLALPLVAAAQSRGIPLSNDSQVFLEAAPCPVIGITGSAGKTTTTTLVGRMAQAAASSSQPPRHAFVGGNIGSPLISVVDEMQPEDLAVVELSSFQLEIMTRSPQVAAVLNITPNHLDRHASMEAYTAAKARILEFQGKEEAAVLGREDRGAWSLEKSVRGRLFSFGLAAPGREQPGTFIKEDFIYFWDGQQETGLMPRSAVGLRGEHNLLNVLAACAIGAAAGFPAEAMHSGVEGFSGVPHRLEFVRKWRGASWFNDSIATAPERSMAAIRSFDEPLVLLAGGRDKNLPWKEFSSLVRQRVDHLVLFGEAAQKIADLFGPDAGQNESRPYTITLCSELKDAVQAAAHVAEPGRVILLSPGGASFDQFHDFEDRGEAFRRWVMELP